MTSQVHPNSFLSNKVKLGSNVRIGPFCNLDGNIEIDDNTELKSHISISGNTKIGKNNIFYPFSHIGCDPQDLKFKGEDSNLIIGDSNIFRENVSHKQEMFVSTIVYWHVCNIHCDEFHWF